jgi:hypothetical protein
MGVFLLVQDAGVRMAAALAIAVSLGCVNTSILMPFVFALNNTEKLYAVVGSNALICLLMALHNGGSGNSLQTREDLLVSFAIVVLALSATLFFKKDCFLGESKGKSFDIPKMHFGAYLMLILSCIFAILGKGVGKGLLNVDASETELPLIALFQIGSLLDA